MHEIVSFPRRSVQPAMESLEGRQILSTMAPASIAVPSVDASHNHHVDVQRPATTTQWAWLTNTYWYVPTKNLPATVYSPSTGSLSAVADQTVYHISGYANGYFWGETVSQLDSSTPSSNALVGSVTPQGKVLLTFFSSSNVTQGYGVMTRQHGLWKMENQMSTSAGPIQIGHWAYMAQTRPGMPSWNSLPSADVSVPTFMSNYSEPVPTPT